MQLQQRINAFSELGHFISQFSTNNFKQKSEVLNNDLFYDGFKHQIKLAQENNGWFTKDNIVYALNGWATLLNKNNILNWLNEYSLSTIKPKKVAIIMAGNIPLVGFHDFLTTLITGHHVLIKQSSNDKYLLPYLAKYLEYIEPSFKGKIKFTEEKLQNFEAVIATGSDNSARYFEYYFKNKPSIIRKNRNSIAIITGNETKEELKALSEDIFRYFGLGCRSVSKLFVPKNYNFDAFFESIYHWHPIINDAKYANNYDYNKAVYLMSEFNLLENGFLMIKEDQSYASPIATLFYEYYDDITTLKTKLGHEKEKIQCIVSKGVIDNEVHYGETQTPKLSNFADNINTIQFLLNI